MCVLSSIFFHRALLALRAPATRSSDVMFFARIFPPRFPQDRKKFNNSSEYSGTLPFDDFFVIFKIIFPRGLRIVKKVKV
jgi:hypothetical protein